MPEQAAFLYLKCGKFTNKKTFLLSSYKETNEQ